MRLETIRNLETMHGSYLPTFLIIVMRASKLPLQTDPSLQEYQSRIIWVLHHHGLVVRDATNALYIRVRVDIIGHARIIYVGKYQPYMV